MNKKRKWTVGRLLSGALALLGFAGCNNTEYGPDLYGTPSVDYRVMGTVTDANGKPIQGIQVAVNKYYYTESSSGVYPLDTLYTNSSGAFETEKIRDISYDELLVEIQDVDGEANGGNFEGLKLTKGDFEKKQVKKGDGWYNGEFEFSKDIQLTKRQ